MAVNKDNVKIHVSHLKKNFDKLEVLKDISVDIYEGEVVVILGPSGSGKSTFLRCLNRLEDITDGQVVVDGHHMDAKDVDLNKVRENIGMVFQHFNLFNNLNVLDNLTLAPVELKKADKNDAVIIFLTSKDKDEDVVKGFSMGACDYIKKPFSVMELITRVKALLRRTETDEAGVLDVGEIELNHERHAVTVSGKQVELTFKEYELLRYLMANKNIVLSRDSIT